MGDCGHKQVVIHRRSARTHRIRAGDTEVSCICDPGLVCPLCDWDLFNQVCFTVADDELVDQLLEVPPGKPVN